MIVNTTRFGVVEVEEDSIVTMPDGMIGFEQYRTYVLIEHRPESLFRWLQSTEQPDLAFLVVDPSDFFTDYLVDLQDPDVERLDLRDPSEAVVLTTASVDLQDRRITTNLLAPVVVNGRTRQARQVVMDHLPYALRQEIGSPDKANEAPRRPTLKAA